MSVRAQRQEGVTLVELVIVVAILSVMMVVALPAYQGYLDEVDVKAAESDLFEINGALARYYASYSQYPPDLQSANLAKLDPWGNNYQYLNMALANGNGQKRKDKSLVPINSDFDLYSMGPDGQSVPPLTARHSRDDILRANDGAYFGPAADY